MFWRSNLFPVIYSRFLLVVALQVWTLKLYWTQNFTAKKMVKGLPEIEAPSHVCEECVIAKQHRELFPKECTWRANHVLQLVHSDIYGPMNPTSNNNKRYFITFTNDFNRKTWVYFLAKKSEAIEIFKRFKARVKKEKKLFNAF